MIGISVSASTVNVNKVGMGELELFSVDVSSRESPSRTSARRRNESGTEQHDDLPEAASNGDSSPSLSARRNSYSLMSLNKLRKMKLLQKQRHQLRQSTVVAEANTSIGVSGARHKTQADADRRRSRAISTVSAMRTQITRINEAQNESFDDRPRRPLRSSAISRGSEYSVNYRDSMADSRWTMEQQQGEQPERELSHSRLPQFEDLKLDKVRESLLKRSDYEVPLRTRFVLACVSSVIVVCFCLLFGIALCEIELANLAGVPDIVEETVLIDKLLSAIRDFSDVSNLTDLHWSLEQALLSNGLSARQTKIITSPGFDSSRVTYATGFYVVWTAITTVGYGNLAPLTWPGRLFTIAAATLGIPLFLINATHLANFSLCLLAEVINQLCKLVRDVQSNFVLQMRSATSKNTVQAANYPVNFLGYPLAILSLVIVVTTIVALIFWPFMPKLDAFELAYFSYISLTTIGFGDITVAVQDSWMFYFLGPIAICGIGLYAFFSEFLRFQYLRLADKLLKLCKRILKIVF